MKQIIINALKNGYSGTKKYHVCDLCKSLYFLKYIFVDDSESLIGNISCLSRQVTCNAFWNVKNNQNRINLINDISKVKRFNINDAAYYQILNRFENGDKYGICCSL